ncbi:cytochrome P450 [Saccharothrix sp. NRRL B-16314]|uniref:cytochrome P450 n=1 Tax=Saccharothrix sp. NRRL B-16314 TaxID=1463825 RepID=UPI00052478F9|nr:cytochrome P450 [Saccharothrix sp. NRRL B-16314]
MTTSASDPQFPVDRDCPFAPPAAYERLRERGPITKVRLASGDAWLVSGHEEGRDVLADRRFSSDRRNEGFPIVNADAATLRQLRSRPPLMVGMDGAEHSAARRPLISEFTVKRLAELRSGIQEIVDRFIDEVLATDERPVDLVRALSLPVPSLVICELLGVPYADHDFFQSRTAVAVRRTSAPEERGRAFAELHEYLDDLVTRKESAPGDDLLSRQITRRREDGTFDHSELVSTAFLLLTAGHETTANMISLGVVALLSDPGQLALIKADPGRTPMAVEELLRYFTIADLVTTRVAVEDVEIGGATIRAGDGVIVSMLSANWDPAVFENPGELDVGRGTRHHLAFGFGPHQCLGQNLARMELQVVFDTLFRRIPTLRLATPVDELSFKADAVIYGVDELPVTW